MNGKPWSESELSILAEIYPSESTRSIAKYFGRPVTAIYAAASKIGVKKTPAYIKRECRNIDPETGRDHRFKKGHVSWNKGKVGYDCGGRSAETRFKKGQRPATWVPVGTEVTDRDGYLKRKIKDDAKPGESRFNWQFVHVLVWEKHHGPRPARHVIRFKDGNKTNFSIENLICTAMRDNMRQNTIHNLPDEIVDVIRVKSSLTRQINKRQRQAREKQD